MAPKKADHISLRNKSDAFNPLYVHDNPMEFIVLDHLDHHLMYSSE